ncbi:MAG TPA: hypothetical protein VFC63_07240, partial [Blastocatellia bacterium]|nr:hypothetical protein [Blastocatellia bacterium]
MVSHRCPRHVRSFCFGGLLRWCLDSFNWRQSRITGRIVEEKSLLLASMAAGKNTAKWRKLAS